jgi:hypothetical protein
LKSARNVEKKERKKNFIAHGRREEQRKAGRRKSRSNENKGK